MDTKIVLYGANGEAITSSRSGTNSENPVVAKLLKEHPSITYVSGVGHFLPDHVVTNIDLANSYSLRFGGHLDDSAEQFSADVFSRTGIMARRHAFDQVSLVQLAVNASKNALANSGIKMSQVSHIVIGSTYFGMPTDDFAEQMKQGLGSASVQVEALEYACASAGFCISRALELLTSDASAQHVLVVGADKGSGVINFSDPGTAILFGDGAGALVISRRSSDSEMSSGILATSTSNYPQFADYIFMNSNGKIEMPNGPGVFQEACRAIKATVGGLLSQTNLQSSDLDLLVLHQANMRLPALVAKSFDLVPNKVPTNIRYYGNTSAASPLILASESCQSGLLKKGDLVIIGAVGLGMRASGVLLSW